MHVRPSKCLRQLTNDVHSVLSAYCFIICYPSVRWMRVPIKGKAIVHPRTSHEGPEGEHMYTSTLFSTSALDGSGGWSTPQPGRFTPGKDPVPIL